MAVNRRFRLIGQDFAASSAASSNAPNVFDYTFSSTLIMADPGAGFVRFNNANPVSVTLAAVSETDGNGNDLSTRLALMDVGTTLVLHDPANPGNDLIFSCEVNAVDNTTWWQLAPDHFTGTPFPADGTAVKLILDIQPFIESAANDNDTIYFDEGRFKNTTSIQVNGTLPALGGSFRRNGSASSDPRAALAYLDASSASRATIWYVEGNTANQGFYGSMQSNLGLGDDRFDWGYDGSSTTAIIQMFENLNFVKTADGGFFIEEKSADEAVITGLGEIWLEDTDPQTLRFTNEDDDSFILLPGISEIVTSNANRTFMIQDIGKTIRGTATNSITYTIPANATTAFPIGTVLRVQNDSGFNRTIAITTDTLIFEEDNTTGSRTIADGGSARIQKVATTTWKIGGHQIT